MRDRIAAIVGLTACGKTELSICVAKRLDAEIVSADSVQIYKRLDIGSAKPTHEEMQGVVHHLIDCIPIKRNDFSVAEYQKLAFAAIDDIVSKEKLPLIVGGSGLYINSITRPMDFTQALADESFRLLWQNREAQNKGCAHAQLKIIDPHAAAKLHPNDIKRTIRALEVYHVTGKTITQYGIENAAESPRYDSTIIGLNMPRELLYERIERRVDSMIAAGLIDEVRSILDDGIDPNSLSLQGLGYKELIAAFQGVYSIEEAIADIKLKTRHFAKRQLTWFKKDERIHWIDVSSCSAAKTAEKIIDLIKLNI